MFITKKQTYKSVATDKYIMAQQIESANSLKGVYFTKSKGYVFCRIY